MAKEKYRDRKHMLLLYTDNKQHMEAFEKIKQSYDYASCLHDKDVWTEEDEKKDPKHKAGELKKEHIHVVIRTSNATWNTALCKELNIEEKFCEQAKNIDNALQYLIHYNDTDKAKYDINYVMGPLRTKLVESINKLEKSEGEKVVELIKYIDEYEGILSITTFARYCAVNGYWSEFRRSGAIFCKIIEEHNEKMRAKRDMEKSAGAYANACDQARFEGYVQGHSDRQKEI